MGICERKKSLSSFHFQAIVGTGVPDGPFLAKACKKLVCAMEASSSVA